MQKTLLRIQELDFDSVITKERRKRPWGFKQHLLLTVLMEQTTMVTWTQIPYILQKVVIQKAIMDLNHFKKALTVKNLALGLMLILLFRVEGVGSEVDVAKKTLIRGIASAVFEKETVVALAQQRFDGPAREFGSNGEGYSLKAQLHLVMLHNTLSSLTGVSKLPDADWLLSTQRVFFIWQEPRWFSGMAPPRIYVAFVPDDSVWLVCLQPMNNLEDAIMKRWGEWGIDREFAREMADSYPKNKNPIERVKKLDEDFVLGSENLFVMPNRNSAIKVNIKPRDFSEVEGISSGPYRNRLTANWENMKEKTEEGVLSQAAFVDIMEAVVIIKTWTEKNINPNPESYSELFQEINEWFSDGVEKDAEVFYQAIVEQLRDHSGLPFDVGG